MNQAYAYTQGYTLYRERHMPEPPPTAFPDPGRGSFVPS